MVPPVSDFLDPPDSVPPANPYEVAPSPSVDKPPILFIGGDGELEPPVALSPPRRLWSAFVGSAIAIGAGMVVSTVVLLVAALADGGIDVIRQRALFQAWLSGFLGTPVGLLVVVLPGQLVFLGAALFGGVLSPQSPVDRLALRPGRLPVWTWFVFAVATPCVAMASTLVMNNMDHQPSEHLEMLERMFQMQGRESITLLLFMMCVVPGVAEELLFRGYLQGRLLQRLSPVWAIGISASFFAAAHMDPQHAVGVLPLGIWLGLLAWRGVRVAGSPLPHCQQRLRDPGITRRRAR